MAGDGLKVDILSAIHHDNWDPNFIPLREIISDITGQSGDSILNLFGNIAMFIPYGFLFPIAAQRKSFKINLVPFLNSMVIEIIQLFEGRHCDIDDVILNTVGAIFGWLILMVILNLRRRKSNT